jgi:hypothetical protein
VFDWVALEGDVVVCDLDCALFACLRGGDGVFSLFVSGLDAKLDAVLALQQEQAKRLERVEHLVAAVNPDDPWEAMSQISTQSSSKILRRNLIRLYGGEKCFLTDVEHNRLLPQDDQVVAAHIWPGCRRDNFEGDIDGTRNGLLLLRRIETAFDARRVMFLCDPFTKSIVFRVLDPALMLESNDNVVYDKILFKSLDQKVLTPRKGRRPSFKLLSRHANSAVHLASTNGWISNDLAKEMLEQIQLASPAMSRETTPPLESDSVLDFNNDDGADGGAAGAGAGGAGAGAGGASKDSKRHGKSKKRNKKFAGHVMC